MDEKGTPVETEEGLFLYEEPHERPEEERRPKPTLTLIPFSLGPEWYGAPIEDVREVLEVPSITKVPNLPDFILGVTNIRGNITSVTDLKQFFGLVGVGLKPAPMAGSRILVIRAAKKTTSLLVDSVGKALSLPLDSIQPALSTLPEVKADYLQGQIRLPDGRLLTVLDLEKIMSSQEMLFE